jgi:hypothetical protein|tara:strand:- start:27106 stop:27531 length:426 start_codon:yes stop_codon:yes gene_type:complete
VKRNRLISPENYDFALLGIVVRMKEYSLAWHLNLSPFFNFSKSEDIRIAYLDHSEIQISNYICKSDQHIYTLLKNKLNTEESVNGFLLPELSHFDFFLKLQSDVDNFNLEEIIDVIKKIDKIEYLASLDINKIKNKENVLH